MDRKTHINFWYVVVAIVAVMAFQSWWTSYTQVETVPYSEFQDLLKKNQVEEVLVLQLHFIGHAFSVVAEPREGLMGASPHGPGENAGPRWGARQQQARDQDADLRDRERDERRVTGRARLILFGLPGSVCAASARWTARKASASMARVMWRCQPCQLRASQ